MTNDDNVMISDDGQLTLVKASKQHEGEWKCQATNSEGTTEQKMKVLVVVLYQQVSKLKWTIK